METVVGIVPFDEVCLGIRTEVFVHEQGVPPELEEDGKDPESVHFLATVAEKPVGTARLRWLEARVAKVERVAVLASHRRLGVGRRIMDRVEEYIRERGGTRIVLAAQSSVLNFYAQRGYRVEGDPFLDAGIDHRWMTRSAAPKE